MTNKEMLIEKIVGEAKTYGLRGYRSIENKEVLEKILRDTIPEQVDESKIKELIEFYKGTTIVDWTFVEKALQSLLPTNKE